MKALLGTSTHSLKMFKKILLVCLLIIGTATAHAQTLKITDVDASESKLWNARTKALLGKSFTLTFYDKTVKIDIAGQETVILRKNGSDTYYTSEDSGSETKSWELTTESTLNIITAGTLTIKISDNQSYRFAKLTITGKRF